MLKTMIRDLTNLSNQLEKSITEIESNNKEFALYRLRNLKNNLDDNLYGEGVGNEEYKIRKTIRNLY